MVFLGWDGPSGRRAAARRPEGRSEIPDRQHIVRLCCMLALVGGGHGAGPLRTGSCPIDRQATLNVESTGPHLREGKFWTIPKFTWGP